jgi:hypothetical protein
MTSILPLIAAQVEKETRVLGRYELVEAVMET